ncbi:hypothetical protein Cha6605_1311 [Chamaesiphon minutus PCC 6605]|uniref:Uncharacterized protein n=1 Tax=Chamaesiphon minutus (strain ATCC 27169 / PCC 6605) TaxID=1173020 RepID=K9UDK2_CHAP6|nr:hypothetical protein Cha6605_1311 [Chamaesiphon minutus PCC 6605]
MEGFPVDKKVPSKLRLNNNLPQGIGYKPLLFGKLKIRPPNCMNPPVP